MNKYNIDGLKIADIYGIRSQRMLQVLLSYLDDKTHGGATVSMESLVADLELVPVVAERMDWSPATLKTLSEDARTALKALPEYQAYAAGRSDYQNTLDILRLAFGYAEDLAARYTTRRGPGGGIARIQTESGAQAAPRKTVGFSPEQVDLHRKACDNLLLTSAFAPAAAIAVGVHELRGLSPNPTEMGKHTAVARAVMASLPEFEGAQGKGFRRKPVNQISTPEADKPVDQVPPAEAPVEAVASQMEAATETAAPAPAEIVEASEEKPAKKNRQRGGQRPSAAV